MASYSVHMPFVLLVLLLASCGQKEARQKSKKDGGTSSRRQAEDPSSVDQFKNRLSTRLMVSGKKCVGGEIVYQHGQAIICGRDQYLITFDDINTCKDNGACTEFVVHPIVGDLNLVRRTPASDIYDLSPMSPISSSRVRRMSEVEVQIELNGQANVIFKQ